MRSVDAILVDAVRNGWITLPLIRPLIMPRQPVARLNEILADLAKDRGERQLVPGVRSLQTVRFARES